MTSADTPERFFDELYQRYRATAARSENEVIEPYRLAGAAVEVRFATAFTHDRLHHALAPFSARIMDPEFTILALELPPGDRIPGLADLGAVKPGVVPELTNAAICSYFQCGVDTLSVINYERSLGIFVRSKSDTNNSFDSAAPFRQLLSRYFSMQGRLLAHAAAVAADGRAVLLVGKSGSGKSFASLRALRSGMSYLGDDYVVLSKNSEPAVHALYGSLRAHAADIRSGRYPLNADLTLTDGKGVLWVEQLFPGSLIARAPVHAIALLRQSPGERTECAAISPALACAEFAASTTVQQMVVQDSLLVWLGVFIEGIPCYRVDAGSSDAQFGDTLRSLLA